MTRRDPTNHYWRHSRVLLGGTITNRVHLSHLNGAGFFMTILPKNILNFNTTFHPVSNSKILAILLFLLTCNVVVFVVSFQRWMTESVLLSNLKSS